MKRFNDNKKNIITLKPAKPKKINWIVIIILIIIFFMATWLFLVIALIVASGKPSR